MNQYFEVNFDGIIGPTHNYSGLSIDNVAATANFRSISNPKRAALEGLKKMKFLHDLGIKQAFLPPQERPNIPMLKKLGFTGTDTEILKKTYKTAPTLLSACSSASCMWTANAATISPSIDTKDRKVHITPANLMTNLHRHIEANSTTRILRKIFHNSKYFTVHDPLSGGSSLADEGAANHTRLCPKNNKKGLHLFVYGRSAFDRTLVSPQQYTPRQTMEASTAIVRTHNLDDNYVVYAQQNNKAIDAGVFHNDVISVGNENLFFYHENAFADTKNVINNLKVRYKNLYKQELICLKVLEKYVPLKDAIKTYLFNSQIVTLPSGKMSFIAPMDCKENSKVKKYLDDLVKKAKTPISKVHYIDVRQSMRNGGGPACLRLRVVLNEKELNTLPRNFLFSEKMYNTLCAWVKRHYRDKLRPKDLADPKLLQEGRKALTELWELLEVKI